MWAVTIIATLAACVESARFRTINKSVDVGSTPEGRTVVIDTSNSDGNPPDPDNIFQYSDGARHGNTVMPDTAGYTSKELCSGDPNRDEAKATIKQTVEGQGDYLVAITFEYRYILGYCGGNSRCEPQSSNPEFFLTVIPSWNTSGAAPQKVYSSGHLSDGPTNGTYYNYDACTGNHQIGCYSPLVQVDAKYINLLHPKGEPLTLQFDFKNYKRNMQIPLKDGTGMALTLHYSDKPQKKPTALGGVVFLALTLGGMATYFAIGAILLHTRGQTGRELIIHQTFWSGVPSLVKEGCQFTLKKIVGLRMQLGLTAKYESI